MNKTASIRLSRINQLRDIIKKVRDEERKIIWNDFIFECCGKWGVARRTAIEYLQIVLAQLNIKKEDVING